MYLKKNNTITLKKIAEFTSSKLIGNPDLKINNFLPLQALQPNAISFFKGNIITKIDQVSLADTAIFITENAKLPENPKANYLLTNNPQKSLIKALELFFTPLESDGIVSESAKIAASAKIGKNASIKENVIIGENVMIGDNTIIFPNTTIYAESNIGSNSVIHSNVSIREYSQIGDQVIIHNGVVIAADGFGYLPNSQGLLKVPQVGNVIIKDYVEIGANTCIDRATLGSTIIETGTKIDNQVQIGHNVSVGKFSVLCGHVAIAGSCQIGDQCILGGSVGVADHLAITSNVRIAGASVVRRDITEAGDYAGDPAMKAKEWKKKAVKS